MPPGYGIEHAQCVPPSEFSEPSFITESYQTLHPISSEELLSLKYESDFPSVLLREPPQDALQADYFSIKQEVVTPDNMCMGRASRGEAGLEPGAGVDSCSSHLLSSGNGSGDGSVLSQPSPNMFCVPGWLGALPAPLSREKWRKVFLSSPLLPVFTSSAEMACFCALMSNLSEIGLGFHVIREDKPLGARRNPIFQEPRQSPTNPSQVVIRNCCSRL